MGTIPSPITDLIDILRHEADLLTVLLDQAVLERQAMRSLALAQCVALNAARAETIQEMARLEQRRARIVGEWAAYWGLSVTALDLSTLASRLQTADAEALAAAHTRLQPLVERLREALTLNRLVVTRFLGFMEQGLMAWNLGASPEKTYSASGESRVSGPHGRLLRQKG